MKRHDISSVTKQPQHSASYTIGLFLVALVSVLPQAAFSALCAVVTESQISRENADALFVIDVATHTVVDRINLPELSTLEGSIAISGDLAYVPVRYGRLALVDLRQKRQIASLDIPGADDIQAVTVSQDGGRVYVAGNSLPDSAASSPAGYVAAIDAGTHQIVRHFTLAGMPTGLVVNPTDGLVYVTQFIRVDAENGGRLTILSESAAAPVLDIPLERSGSVTFGDGDVSPLAFVNAGSSVLIVNPRTQEVRRIATGDFVWNNTQTIAVDFSRQVFAITCIYDGDTCNNRLAVVDTETQKLSALIPLAGGEHSAPSVATLPPNGKFVYAISSGGIAVLDTYTLQQTAFIPLASGGGSIAFAQMSGGCRSLHCIGDCNGDGSVTIREQLTSIYESMKGSGDVCYADVSGDNAVQIEELVRITSSKSTCSQQ